MRTAGGSRWAGRRRWRRGRRPTRAPTAATSRAPRPRWPTAATRSRSRCTARSTRRRRCSTGGVHHIVDGNDELLATPPEAPASVAASVVITGLHLHAGFAYACRVQRNLQGAAYPVAIVPGSYVPSMRGVRCVVPPPVSGDNARVAIKVSLDGGETFNSNGAGNNAGAADFYFREPPTLATALDNPRAPIVSSPMGGAALVWLEGTFLGADGASAVECRFGATAVRATRESESRVRCVSPEGDWARLRAGRSRRAAPRAERRDGRTTRGGRCACALTTACWSRASRRRPRRRRRYGMSSAAPLSASGSSGVPAAATHSLHARRRPRQRRGGQRSPQLWALVWAPRGVERERRVRRRHRRRHRRRARRGR